MNEAGKTSRAQPANDLLARALERDWKTVSGFLREHPQFIREDAALLAELGLWLKADNIVEFGPAALARLSEAKTREKTARQELEDMARENFAAQTQTHAAVVDILDARNHSDLARRLDEIAQLRFGLVGAVIAIEGPERVPAGWRGLQRGMTDQILGPKRLSRMGRPVHAEEMFGKYAPEIQSTAMARVSIWEPGRAGLLVFGSADPEGFTSDMAGELVSFLARVVERTAERWPVL